MNDKKIPPFVHLHVHSHYSLLDGLGKLEDILDRAKEYGMNSIALTDHGVMYGIPEFYDKAKQRGIKAIAGCEFYLAPNGLENKRPKLDEERFHLILLAENNTGYENLMKLTSEAHLKGFYYKPRIDKRILKKYSEGIIGMSACVQGEIAQLIIRDDYEGAKKAALEYQKILGKNNFFLELQYLPKLPIQDKANKGLRKISKETGIPMTVSSDIHYVNKEDAEVQDILLCLQTNRKVNDANRMSMMDHPLYLKSPEEMFENFQDIPEALENTQKIADRCNITIEFGNTKLPFFEVPKGETDESYLRKLCEEGLKERYPNPEDITDVHRERLDYELGIISKMGFPSYFLIVQDFMNWSRSQGIVVGPGRGSAAGSFVSYLTKITNLDPIKYKLMFERFLNPDRISMPDVDADFADHRRDEVLQYCRDKYGADHVAQIITFGTMASRVAIRDVGRVLDVEYAYCDKLAKTIPAFTNLQEALDTSQELIQEYNTNTSAKKIVDAALRLEGIVRHASVHACGVVITKDPVTKYSPIQYMAGKEGGGVVTQYAASSRASYVEKIGLLKMDFLGLKNLTIIENALKIIEKTTGDKIDIENLPLDDKESYNLLQKGDTTGVFQLESAGMKRYLKKLKPTVLEDIIAMVALYRPGPMEWIPDFIDGKHGKKKVTYLHPNLEPILKNTYGVAVYQEQVMEIAKGIAGFTGGEADTLRKVMGKKIVEMIAEQKKKFIEGAVKNNGLKAELAEKIFSFIEPFAGYGFNRSHAACYALIGYQTAFLKAHYPAQFMAALLNSDKNDTDRIAIEIEETRQMGIEVLPPAINESFKSFAVIINKEQPKEKPKIRFGLEAIKGVGEHISEMIIKEREKSGRFKDLIDLVERVRDRDMNKKSLEALAMSGALDEVAEANSVIANVETVLSYAKDFQKNAAAGQSSLFAFGGENEIKTPKVTLESVMPIQRKQKLSWEKQLLGLYISDHPLRGYQEYFKKKAIPINQLGPSHINQVITVGGIVEKVQKIYTRRNQLMYFVTIEDGLRKIEVLVFPKHAEASKELWVDEKIVLIKGKLSDKDGEFKLLLEDVVEVDRKELERYRNDDATFSTGSNFGDKKEKEQKRNICIKIEKKDIKENLPRLFTIINECPQGDCRLCFIQESENQRLETSKLVEYKLELVNKIENILGKKTVSLEKVIIDKEANSK